MALWFSKNVVVGNTFGITIIEISLPFIVVLVFITPFLLKLFFKSSSKHYCFSKIFSHKGLVVKHSSFTSTGVRNSWKNIWKVE